MGALLGKTCYVTQSEALDAHYSNVPPALTSGTTNYLTEFNKVAGVWKQSSYSIDSSGIQILRYTIDAPSITFPTCDPVQSFNDGMIIGWGIATSIILVSALKLMQRAK